MAFDKEIHNLQLKTNDAMLKMYVKFNRVIKLSFPNFVYTNIVLHIVLQSAYYVGNYVYGDSRITFLTIILALVNYSWLVYCFVKYRSLCSRRSDPSIGLMMLDGSIIFNLRYLPRVNSIWRFCFFWSFLYIVAVSIRLFEGDFFTVIVSVLMQVQIMLIGINMFSFLHIELPGKTVWQEMKEKKKERVYQLAASGM